MKRKQLLLTLYLIPLLLLQSCKKAEFPSTPTIVTGKVVDENDVPIEDYEFQFSGFNKTGLISGNTTFNIYSSTNKEGIFYYSKIVPAGSDLIEFQPIGVKLKNGLYDPNFSNIYVLKNGNYILAPISGPIVLGQKNVFNYKVKNK